MSAWWETWGLDLALEGDDEFEEENNN